MKRNQFKQQVKNVGEMIGDDLTSKQLDYLWDKYGDKKIVYFKKICDETIREARFGKLTVGFFLQAEKNIRSKDIGRTL